MPGIDDFHAFTSTSSGSSQSSGGEGGCSIFLFWDWQSSESYGSLADY